MYCSNPVETLCNCYSFCGCSTKKHRFLRNEGAASISYLTVYQRLYCCLFLIYCDGERPVAFLNARLNVWMEAKFIIVATSVML